MTRSVDSSVLLFVLDIKYSRFLATWQASLDSRFMTLNIPKLYRSVFVTEDTPGGKTIGFTASYSLYLAARLRFRASRFFSPKIRLYLLLSLRRRMKTYLSWFRVS